MFERDRGAARHVEQVKAKAHGLKRIAEVLASGTVFTSLCYCVHCPSRFSRVAQEETSKDIGIVRRCLQSAPGGFIRTLAALCRQPAISSFARSGRPGAIQLRSRPALEVWSSQRLGAFRRSSSSGYLGSAGDLGGVAPIPVDEAFGPFLGSGHLRAAQPKREQNPHPVEIASSEVIPGCQQ